MKQSAHSVWVGLSFLVVGLAVGLAVSSGNFLGANLVGTNDEQETPKVDVDTLETVAVNTDDDPVLGDAAAALTIIEFSDYQCPYCLKFYSASLPLLIDDYIDEDVVKLVYRDFPLPIHSEAKLAAEAAECVGKSGDELYFKMHDFLFERTSEWSKNENAIEVLIGFGSELGVDIRSCLENGEMTAEVEADYTAGRSYGVTGTPTFFFNGKKLVGAWPYEVIESVIEALL